MTDWALLRQVVLATPDIAADGRLLREHLGLGAGFADPELAAIGMADDTMALAGGSYLELVAPLTPDVSIARWLARRGPGGYALSVQHGDPLAARDRALKLGVRVVADQLVMGHPIVQFHPADAGLLLELDGIAERDAWFWDGMGVDPSPHALVDDVVSVTVPARDPATTVELWAEILGYPAASAGSIDLGGRLVHFRPAAETPRWTITLRRSALGGALRDETLLGAAFRYE
ncbi:VOC family protein [Dactylosporangium darangshiense]|uniref:Glyoxalase-like domain-containing protein n=1 Tax=Dactylosporangium darangshiense TaxID=579108 RepID=A0ABP8DQ82_9ACTN